jgi:competence protein ComEC
VLAAPLESVRVVGRRGGLNGLVDRLRMSARARLNAGLSPPVGPVLQGMVLGDDEAVDAASITDFRRSGLLHILAVSGENVVLLCSIWSFGLLLVGVPRTVRMVVSLPVVIAYVLLTGASPSIVRAGIAGCVGALAALASRPSDGWLLWLFPAAAMLTLNPYTVLDVSFQLSFGAVFGLLVLSRRLSDALRFLPGPLAEQIGVTTAASLATAPISLATFGQTSLVAVPANVAGGFALGPIMFLGMMSVLGGLVLPIVSVPINLVNGVCIGFLLTVARMFGDLSFAVYEWHGPTLALTVALGGYLADRGRRPRLVGGTAALLAAILIVTPPPPSPPGLTTVSFLDVGEGAATLIQVPHGPTVLIDGGPLPLDDQLRAHGVDAVDLLILSHPHADHIGGLAAVVDAMPVRAALLPQPLEPSPALESLRASLIAAGADVRSCGAALTLQLGPLTLNVLPTRSQETEGNQAENDHALVVVADLAEPRASNGPRDSSGWRMLIPGDAETPALRGLGLSSIAVVELPHHGSSGGLDESLLKALHPKLAVVSVGADNRYGHPAAAMLNLLAAAGIPCLRTDQVGEVDLALTQAGLTVRTARPPPAMGSSSSSSPVRAP